jgi:hypothetical protein
MGRAASSGSLPLSLLSWSIDMGERSFNGRARRLGSTQRAAHIVDYLNQLRPDVAIFQSSDEHIAALLHRSGYDGVTRAANGNMGYIEVLRRRDSCWQGNPRRDLPFATADFAATAGELTVQLRICALDLSSKGRSIPQPEAAHGDKKVLRDALAATAVAHTVAAAQPDVICGHFGAADLPGLTNYADLWVLCGRNRTHEYNLNFLSETEGKYFVEPPARCAARTQRCFARNSSAGLKEKRVNVLRQFPAISVVVPRHRVEVDGAMIALSDQDPLLCLFR